MNETADPHPNWEQLLAFDRGQLSPAERVEVERHIGRCDACCGKLEQLPEDPLGQAIRQHAGLHGANHASVPANIPPELASHPRYRILATIGIGGMGTVYKAEHRLMERLVALKVMNRDVMAKPAAVERFRLEVKAAALLSHRHIVTAYDAEQAGDSHFLVMEFVEGYNLQRLVQEQGPLPVAYACRLVSEAASGLHYAFEQGMVHRDIKPANLLLTTERHVKILDFGLARFAREAYASDSLTPTGAILGTPDYMAPEQALDPRHADIRADIYSLGCTLYYLLAGRPPFPTGAPLQKLLAHRSEVPPPLTDFRKDVPSDLRALVQRLLAKDPNQRPSTPDQVVKELARFAEPPSGSSTEVVLTKSGVSCVARTCGYGRFRWVAMLLGLVLVLGVGIYGFWALTKPAEMSSQATTPQASPVEQPQPKAIPGEAWCLSSPGVSYTAVCFCADHKQALAARADRRIDIWDLQQGQQVGVLSGQPDTILGLHVSRNGFRALSAGQDRAIHVWDLRGRAQVKALERHTNWVKAVFFCPDGRHALSAGDDGLLVLWDTDEGRVKRALGGGQIPILSVASSPSGRHALAGDANGSIRLWDLAAADKAPVLTYQGHVGNVGALSYDATGRYFVSGSADRTVRFWRVSPAHQLRALPGHSATVRAVALGPEDRWALSGGADRTVRLWDLATSAELARFEGHTDEVLAVAFTADGRRALSGSKDGTLRCWQLPEVTDPWRRLFHPAAVLSVDLTRDGKTLVTGGEDKVVRIWEATTGRLRQQLTGHTKWVWSVALAEDGKLAASAGDDATIRIWDVAAGKERFVLQGHTKYVRCILFSADGKTLISGSWDGTVKVWDVATGAELSSFLVHEPGVSALAISPDGKTVASASRGRDREGKAAPGELKIWNLTDGPQEAALSDLRGPARGLTFSADGKLLLWGDEDRHIRVWEIARRQERPPLRGHTDWVRHVALTADGQWLVSASSDNTVKLWDFPAGTVRATLRGHTGGVAALALTPDGKTLVTAGEDQVAYIWDVTVALRRHVHLASE
jgi:WD40 repeat protein/predicted Ser/Thr protein kinase